MNRTDEDIVVAVLDFAEELAGIYPAGRGKIFSKAREQIFNATGIFIEALAQTATPDGCPKMAAACLKASDDGFHLTAKGAALGKEERYEGNGFSGRRILWNAHALQALYGGAKP
jgi:hypothetical protein